MTSGRPPSASSGRPRNEEFGHIPARRGHSLDPRRARRYDRYSQLCVAAAHLAVQDARLRLGDEDRERVGVCVGSIIGCGWRRLNGTAIAEFDDAVCRLGEACGVGDGDDGASVVVAQPGE